VGATAVLNGALALELIPYLVPPFLATALFTALGVRRGAGREKAVHGPTNPLEIRAALQMALLFQAVLFLVHEVRRAYGGVGLAVTGAILGLTDMDALTISMARSAADPEALRSGAVAIAVGVLSNTMFKIGVAAFVGRGSFRTIAPGGLALSAAASAGAILVLR
jgi:uncharacterized membrane protein (DUF4010 family)